VGVSTRQTMGIIMLIMNIAIITKIHTARLLRLAGIAIELKRTKIFPRDFDIALDDNSDCENDIIKHFLK